MVPCIGSLTYTPNTGFAGDDTFQYKANDGTADSTAATVTIHVQPSITISDLSANEGNSGTTPFNFTVTLSAASNVNVTVNYATADGTAQVSDSDYAAGSGTVTFTPGQTSQTITAGIRHSSSR